MRYRVKVVLEEKNIREQVFIVDSSFTRKDALLALALSSGVCISDEEVDCIDSTIEEYEIEEVEVGN